MSRYKGLGIPGDVVLITEVSPYGSDGMRAMLLTLNYQFLGIHPRVSEGGRSAC